MKIERKFHKGAQFNKPCNMHLVLRVDDLKKVKDWPEEDLRYALDLLEIFKKDIDRQVKHMKECRIKN